MAHGLTLLTPPTGEPLSLAEARHWLRIDDDDDSQDRVILRLIRRARTFVEEFTGRQLVSAKYRLALDAFPCDGVIRLDRVTPLQAVTAVQYYDADEVQQTLATTAYDVDAARVPGTIHCASDQSWPSTYRRPDAVTVDFWAGYGPVTATQAGFEAGERTVTPNSMAGIYAGTELLIGDGDLAERIVVTSVASATFTATFARGHPDPCDVRPALPEKAIQAMELLVCHWFEHRGDELRADAERALQAAESLLMAAWTGVYP